MKLLSWGANSYSQLGHGIQSEECLFPTEVVLPHAIDDIISISAGGGHSLILDGTGTLFGSGSNKNGQLADSGNNVVRVFSKLEALQEFKFVYIESGWESSFAITDSGSLVAWGSNKFGQLGVTKEKVTTTKHPIVPEVPKITQVAAGLRHTAVVSTDGHVYTCGSSSKGQLGVLQSDGSTPKSDFDYFTKVEGVENAVQVACGQHHTLALTADGDVYGWGDNKWGQLGEGEPLIPSPQPLMACRSGALIRAGWTHSALLTGGLVLTWGRNSYCQLGHSWGKEKEASHNQVSALRGVEQLELGSEHNLALTNSGEVWSWGWNEHGNCGTGTINNVAEPQQITTPFPVGYIAAGGGHSLALSRTNYHLPLMVLNPDQIVTGGIGSK